MMRAFSGLLLAAGLTACATTPDQGGASANLVTLEGNVTYRERIALFPEARITVEIRDVSRQGAPAIVISGIEFGSDGRQVPIPFSLEYDRTAIEPGHTYSVFSRITGPEDRVMWITDTHNPLPPPGEAITLTLVRATGGGR